MSQSSQATTKCHTRNTIGCEKQVDTQQYDAWLESNNDQSHLSLIAKLVEYELAQRNANRIRRNYKQARFPANKRLEQFDFQHQTTITKQEVNELLDFNFIDELGYLPMNSQSRYNLFQLINSLYEYRSIILTTNKNFAS